MSTTFDPFEALSPAGAVRRKRTFLLAVLLGILAAVIALPFLMTLLSRAVHSH